ncbi:hypothetical protein ES705_07144 [subsurface metagenome]
MDKKIKSIIWKKIDELRISPSFRFSRYSNTSLLERIGNDFGIDKLQNILKDEELTNTLLSRDFFQIPTHLINFIKLLDKDLNPKSYFDPWITAESYLIRQNIPNPSGYCINQTEFEIIKSILGINVDRIELGDGLKLLNANKSKFDFVSCFPPFGLRTKHISEKASSNDYATDLLIECSSQIYENGILVFLVSPRFVFNEKTKALLVENEISINGLFHLPEGTFAPNTNISSYLVVASKEKSEKCFVAELTSNESTNQVIFNNYKKKQKGKSIQLGRLVNYNTFTSFRALVYSEKIETLGKRTGLAPINISELVNEIFLLKEDTKDEVTHINNSIYIPKVGKSEVINEPSKMQIKPKNYFQIVVNSDKANSTFLSNYFNTPLGELSIESLKVGTVISNLTKLQLLKISVYIPNLETQLNIVETSNKIEQLALNISDLKTKLWKQPKAINSINEELLSFEKDDKIELWIDTLPFPISSILWKYYATNENNKKVEHLLHFFEAFSEFLSMIMLSAFNQNKEFYKAESHRWLKIDDKFKTWYLKSDFGGWNNLTANLSKATRTLLNDKDNKNLCTEIFGNPSKEFFNFITSKGIINLLNDVREYRNKWKGHGGVTSEQEYKNRVTILEQKLTELREHIGEGFSDCRLISAKTNTYSNGVFTYNAKELIGNRTPFNETEIESLIPLDVSKLYFIHSGQNKPIELLPFIKYNQETKACYFYNSIEGSDIRWVSFHYEKISELNEKLDEKFNEILNILKLNEE